MTEREEANRRAPLRAVESYWHALCTDGQVPLRSQIDPRGMESALENAFLIEKIAPSMAKFRVAGSHLSDLMGMQVAGMPLSTFIAPDDRARFGEAVERLFADPAIVHITLSAEDGFGKPEMTADLILMPLRSDFGEISRGLGALISHGRIGRTPRRFRITGVKVERALGSVTSLKSKSKPLPKTTRGNQIPGFAELRTPYQPPQRDTAITGDTGQSARKGHLRLVVSND